MDASDWETIAILGEGDESEEPILPVDIECPFEDIRSQLDAFEKTHKGNYDEIRFLYKYKPLGYGAMKKWYEIQGRFESPQKQVLYGSRKITK